MLAGVGADARGVGALTEGVGGATLWGAGVGAVEDPGGATDWFRFMLLIEAIVCMKCCSMGNITC